MVASTRSGWRRSTSATSWVSPPPRSRAAERRRRLGPAAERHARGLGPPDDDAGDLATERRREMDAVVAREHTVDHGRTVARGGAQHVVDRDGDDLSGKARRR